MLTSSVTKEWLAPGVSQFTQPVLRSLNKFTDLFFSYAWIRDNSSSLAYTILGDVALHAIYSDAAGNTLGNVMTGPGDLTRFVAWAL